MKLRIVNAGQGFQWMKQGLHICRKHPFNFIGLMGLCVSAAMLLIGLPIVGPLIVVGCMPLMWLAFMQATLKTLKGERPHPGVLFEAFKGPKSPRIVLAQLAGGYVMATLVVMFLAQMLGPDSEDMAALFKDAENLSDVVSSPLFVQDMMWRVALTIPVSLIFWHAPALILWARLNVGKALFFSAVACWRNLSAYAVYAICWLGVILALGFIDRLILSQIPTPLIGNVLAIAGGMWVASAFYASLYFTVVDCFDADMGGNSQPTATPKE